MPWFDIVVGAPLDLCMVFLVFAWVAGLVRSAKVVQAGFALPVLHLFIAGVIAAAIVQIKAESFILAVASLTLASVCLYLLTRTKHQGRLMRHLLVSKATDEETQWKLVRIYGLAVGGTAVFLAMVSLATYLTLLCAITAGVFIESGLASALQLRAQRLVLSK